MKQVVIAFLLPICIALATTAYFSCNHDFNSLLFPNKRSAVDVIDENINFIENFSSHPEFETDFLKPSTDFERIYILGSSELAASSPALPYQFISTHYSTKVFGIGHAGNQCLSIFSQLLSHVELLDKSRIVVILSPGWFESKPSKGTSSAVFLEYNSPNFLRKILRDTSNSIFHSYLNKRISELYPEITSPHLELNMLNFSHRSSLSVLHKIVYAPLLFCDEKLVNLKYSNQASQNYYIEKSNEANNSNKALQPNWDSIFSTSRKEVLAKSTNNSLGINDTYYTEFIHGKIGSIQTVPAAVNQELADFKMLVKLLKEKKAAASFIISPLNPHYYQNLKELEPTIKTIVEELNLFGLPYLNFFETDTKKYEKAVLQDVMHFSDFGWYKVNKFIIETYQLNNEKNGISTIPN